MSGLASPEPNIRGAARPGAVRWWRCPGGKPVANHFRHEPNPMPNPEPF